MPEGCNDSETPDSETDESVNDSFTQQVSSCPVQFTYYLYDIQTAFIGAYVL